MLHIEKGSWKGKEEIEKKDVNDDINANMRLGDIQLSRIDHTHWSTINMKL